MTACPHPRDNATLKLHPGSKSCKQKWDYNIFICYILCDYFTQTAILCQYEPLAENVTMSSWSSEQELIAVRAGMRRRKVEKERNPTM
jgi:hypothetical protein